VADDVAGSAALANDLVFEGFGGIFQREMWQ
jgi:hypothetical protein